MWPMVPHDPYGGMPPYMPPIPPPPPPAAVEQIPMTLPNDKDQLGEYLYALVEKKNPQNAAKITGMLLEMEIDQIQNIIRNQSQLDKWITEALKVYIN